MADALMYHMKAASTDVCVLVTSTCSRERQGSMFGEREVVAPVAIADDKDPSNVFTRLSPPIFDDLKPLPVFSGMITSDQKADELQPRRFSKPFDKFKIEVVNNVADKRKSHDSSPDATPLKKPFGSKALSPDLRCFVECSPLGRGDSASPFATSSLMHKTQDVGSEIKETVSSQLLSENLKHVSSIDPGGRKETKVGELTCEEVLLNLSSTFDYDVDDLLCLEPDSPARFLVDEESCRNPISQDDGGYFSLSCINYHNGGGWVNSEQLTANLNPCAWAAAGDCYPQSSSSKSQVPEPTVTSEHFIIAVDNLSPSDSRPALEYVDSKADCLESCDAEEEWDIGPPMFESSICHSETNKLNAEQSRQVLEEVQESVNEPVHSTLAREDSTVETSYETTLPLQVQVKSKVVVPSQHPNRSSAASSLVPVVNRETTNSVRSLQPAKRPAQRPVVFSSEVEWNQEKKLYVHSVVSHMYENPGVDNGVTSELQNLMSHVADESTGAKGREWQHPSDLTRRNYRRRFGTAAAEITLDKWRAKNGLKHKRFDKFPKIFERSPFP